MSEGQAPSSGHCVRRCGGVSGRRRDGCSKDTLSNLVEGNRHANDQRAGQGRPPLDTCRAAGEAGTRAIELAAIKACPMSLFSEWNLSDQIAAIAVVVGVIQAIALIWTIRVIVANGRRQLRAYLFIDQAMIEWVSTENAWKVRYRLKNYGSTPARQTRITDLAKAIDWPTQHAPAPDRSENYGSVAPNGDFIDLEYSSVRGATFEEVQSKIKAIMLVGRIAYRDAFRRKCVTDFCFYHTGERYPRDEMIIYKHGNEFR
jgi:hypothetical protein